MTVEEMANALAMLTIVEGGRPAVKGILQALDTCVKTEDDFINFVYTAICSYEGKDVMPDILKSRLLDIVTTIEAQWMS